MIHERNILRWAERLHELNGSRAWMVKIKKNLE